MLSDCDHKGCDKGSSEVAEDEGLDVEEPNNAGDDVPEFTSFPIRG
jgi:hypothetical protein